ncbi:MAG: serine/threonine protein kinase [Ktedonobacteraceae bacterium]
MALDELQNGRYRSLRLLGSGGMGEVYLMNDTRVSRQVAIKVIRSEGAPYPGSDSAKDAARLFQREAKAIAALDHPHILPLYDFGEESIEDITMSYMVMPFCTEGSLAGWLRQSGSAMLTPPDIAQLVEQAADALQYAHDHQVIHLDVKPSNFLLRSNRKNPNCPTLLLADFGIARSSTTAASSSRTIRGTPTSMAPEQWSSMTVPATDQYALAIMVYEIVAGRPPFVGGMEQLMYQHFNVQPSPPSKYNPQLSAAVDAVILRALEKKPEDRFPSITDFAREFEQAMQLLPARLVVRPQQPNADDITRDIRTTLAISTVEAEAGTSRMITLPGGQQVKVTVPPGAVDGQTIRLQDLGDATIPVDELILTIAIISAEETHLPANPISTEHTLLTPQNKVQLPFEPSPDHDLPTIASSSNPNLQRTPEGQQQPPAPGRRRVSIPMTVGIISGVIVLLLLAGTLYFYNSSQANAHTLALTQTATALALTPKHAATVRPTPSPTPIPPGMYIAGTYNGSMSDGTTGQTSTVSVVIVQSQRSGVLNGKFTSQGTTYTLKGRVDMQGNFSFTVQQPAGQQPLYFYGTVQQGVYLHGTFCHSSTNSCSASTTSANFFTAGPRF